MSVIITNKEFIDISLKNHVNKYDYSLVDYKGAYCKVKIMCKKHGVYECIARYHKMGMCDCPKCVGKIDKEEFIRKAKKIHGNRYIYDKVKFRRIVDLIIIECKVHGEFKQIVRNHLNGSNCPWCTNKAHHTNESFIERAKEIHGNKYNYDKIEYKNINTKINILCPIHGYFIQRPHDHLNGNGCKKCGLYNRGLKAKLSFEEFSNKSKIIHNNKYNYNKETYTNLHNKIEIICPDHGSFRQDASNHLYGENGCPSCISYRSKFELDICTFIKGFYKGKVKEVSKKIISPFEIDLFLEKERLAFEFNGLYWHSEDIVPMNYHKNKNDLCEEKGIHLISLFEDSWVNKKDIIKSRILNKLGLILNKIPARKCKIREVSNKEASEFLLSNHLQGNCIASIKLGLYYENELVSLMTLGKLRSNLGRSHIVGYFELLRFCNKNYCIVMGGINKLFNYFKKNFFYIKILSYADRMWTKKDKSIYSKLGFEFKGVTKPNYFYFKGNKRYNRYSFRKDVLVSKGFDINKTERQIMKENGYKRVYDSGCLKYEYKSED